MRGVLALLVLSLGHLDIELSILYTLITYFFT